MKVKSFCVLLLVVTLVFIFINIEYMYNAGIMMFGIIDSICLGYWALIGNKGDNDEDR